MHPGDSLEPMVQRYRYRHSRLYRFLRPPLPLVHNRNEAHLPKCAGVKLFLGGAGHAVPSSFVNLDIAPFPGVDVVADVQSLPFATGSIAAIECDAVLEHVQTPSKAIEECARVLRPGGFLHVVVPFCHPFHEYPRDFRRWTLDGLKDALSDFEIIEAGVRTGPTATLLTLLLEFVKVASPKRLKTPAYFLCAWLVWPLRYLDLWLNRKPGAAILANHVYALVRKPLA
jgi:SAM-dependent methyltransferase